ncbi:MAG: hypothetical protein KJ709_04580 [Nanoarchaeota archaeon]|nr:hypothetical protein [Nanoarchaeota archaeon]
MSYDQSLWVKAYSLGGRLSKPAICHEALKLGLDAKDASVRDLAGLLVEDNIMNIVVRELFVGGVYRNVMVLWSEPDHASQMMEFMLTMAYVNDTLLMLPESLAVALEYRPKAHCVIRGLQKTQQRYRKPEAYETVLDTYSDKNVQAAVKEHPGIFGEEEIMMIAEMAILRGKKKAKRHIEVSTRYGEKGGYVFKSIHYPTNKAFKRRLYFFSCGLTQRTIEEYAGSEVKKLIQSISNLVTVEVSTKSCLKEILEATKEAADDRGVDLGILLKQIAGRIRQNIMIRSDRDVRRNLDRIIEEEVAKHDGRDSA